jgi:hypothetical protein
VDYSDHSEVQLPSSFHLDKDISIVYPSELNDSIAEEINASSVDTVVPAVKKSIVRMPYGVAVVSNRPCIQALRAYMSAVEPLINSKSSSLCNPSTMDDIKSVIIHMMEEEEEEEEEEYGQIDLNHYHHHHHHYQNHHHTHHTHHHHRMVYEALSPYNLVAVFFASLVSNSNSSSSS